MQDINPDQYFSREDEQRLLGSLISSDVVRGKFMPDLDQADFYCAGHDKVFLAIETLWKANSEVHPASIKKWLKKRKLTNIDCFDREDFIEYLAYEASPVPGTVEVLSEFHFKEVKEKRRSRELLKALDRLDGDGADPDSIIRQIASLVPAEDGRAEKKEKKPKRLPAEVNSELDLLTEVNNGTRMVATHGQNIRWTKQGWYIWTGKRWMPDEFEQVRDLAEQTNSCIVSDLWEQVQDKDALRKFQNRSLSRRGLDNTIELAKSKLGHKLTEFDTDPWILNFRNGTVDLRVKDNPVSAGHIRPHRREDFCTKIIDFDYDPFAKCPEWEAFLDVTFASAELVSYIHRSVGYSISGSTKEQIFFFCFGETGRNGKTTFLETLLYCFTGDNDETGANSYALGGDKQLIMVNGHQTKQGNPYYVRGIRYLPMGEVNDKDKIDESALKNVTGEDTLTGARLFKDPVRFKSIAKVWLRGNEKPRVRATDSVFRRVRCIPFLVKATDEQVAKFDGELGEVLKKERAGIIAWAVLGCILWQSDGKLTAPPEVEKANEEYRSDMDLFGQFFKECCTPDGQELFKDIKNALRAWAADNDYRPWNRTSLVRDLKKHNLAAKEVGGKTYYVGLSLKPEWIVDAPKQGRIW